MDAHMGVAMQLMDRDEGRRVLALDPMAVGLLAWSDAFDESE